MILPFHSNELLASKILRDNSKMPFAFEIIFFLYFICNLSSSRKLKQKKNYNKNNTRGEHSRVILCYSNSKPSFFSSTAHTHTTMSSFCTTTTFTTRNSIKGMKLSLYEYENGESAHTKSFFFLCCTT